MYEINVCFINREKEVISELPKKTEPLLYESEEDHDIKELDEIDVRSDLSDAEPEVNNFKYIIDYVYILKKSFY